MSERRIEIVLDADVIIHFHRGGKGLAFLSDIFPHYTYIVLDKVRNELSQEYKSIVDNSALFSTIKIKPFPQEDCDIIREYAMLTRKFGKGESACMAYCRYTHNVVGSSNLRDISIYCEMHRIAHLGTIDFLYYAIRKELMTEQEAKEFINNVIQAGSKLPSNIDFSTYIPTCTL